jgi:hypothetical protein
VFSGETRSGTRGFPEKQGQGRGVFRRNKVRDEGFSGETRSGTRGLLKCAAGLIDLRGHKRASTCERYCWFGFRSIWVGVILEIVCVGCKC